MRKQVDPEQLHKIMDEVYAAIVRKADRKGWGTHHNIHESSGLIYEEWIEFQSEIHLNNVEGQRNELMDMIVSNVWALLSLKLNHEPKGE